DERRKVVQIKNPLRAEDSFMRTTLVPALIKNIVHNVSHGNREFRLFEISRVFINDRSGVLPKERNHLAAAFYKEKTRTLYRDDVPDFYVFKGVFEAIIKDLKIYDCSFVRSSEPFLHPGQSADIYIGDIKIGHIGALSPLITDSLDIKAHKPSVFVMELDLDTLAPYALKELRYSPLPKYPYIERDTALIIDESIESSMITKWLESYSSDLIEDVSIFDVYKGRNIPEGKKSIAFNVRYRSSDRTLKDDEVDVMHNALVKYIIGKTKGQLRNS
ncbi:MAG: phenylalanine--tRNA ligase subunit beta, partial [Nitrospirae bacterium]|nr:phenylalanine--tRNA ligase subunit beta [Nitrospirota bacterium]